MKKIVIILTLSLLPFFASAQSIESGGIDKFTGKPVVYTSWTSLYTKKAAYLPDYSFNVSFMLRSENEKVFFHLKWNNGIKSIDKGSSLSFMLSDNSIITLRATSNFYADIDVYSSTLNRTDSKTIIHAVYEGDRIDLKDDNLITRLRIETPYGARVYELDKKNAQKISKAYQLIINEINNI
ncbi:MAG: hypothetical protein ACK5KT_03360 [Dysgonomonas sp.]